MAYGDGADGDNLGDDEVTHRIRKIVHVDMDAFYASVEQRDDPTLRGRPVAVGGGQRGVVAAASYEARTFGVRSAMPSVTAARRCPDLVFVKPRFDVYKAVSAQIREIFAEHTDLIEPLSLDEAYLDVTENKQSIVLATDVANSVRARIKEVTGLNSSAGISYNKFLAKMASGHRKPNNFYVIPPGRGAAFVAGLSIEKFHGVGPATAARMHDLGIKTGADLAALSIEEMRTRFGRSAQYWFDLSRGIDERQVNPDRERKSIGAEDTFMEDITAIEDARAMTAPLADKVWQVCEGRQLFGRTVTLKVKFANFEQITRTRSLPAAVRDRHVLGAVVEELLAATFPPRMAVRLLGVTVSNFDRGEQTDQFQMALPIE
ncbi:MAG: DNA polymerase IV [Candidatus Devosia phytovorans]|uniref:DNA polymerase IV n=1 Tax=Candidatus Devosia phytovorans TaxID=3121372 RepID=A0AAJ5VXD4_9HYPH|nr:DNA polymerase IV [Devosia sp.]WEK06688.1 MAG: DNA polymerase IV [Devosia sp.]